MMFWATVSASFLGFAYVGGLYVWRSEHDRDHPETIKRRFLSAFFTSCICPPLVYVFGAPKVSWSCEDYQNNSIFFHINLFYSSWHKTVWLKSLV